ncbi:MAG: hypothetical protein NWE88_08735 [Candidatus Bathyarchaeota archaeon]|nr:hypothetical protein [Candidatus Bathyarchaeota archaeon]
MKVAYMIYDCEKLFKSCDLKKNPVYLIKRLYDNKVKGIINEDYNGSARKAWFRDLVKAFGGTLEIIRESKVKRKGIQHRDNSDELKEALDKYNSGGGVDAIHKPRLVSHHTIFEAI